MIHLFRCVQWMCKTLKALLKQTTKTAAKKQAQRRSDQCVAREHPLLTEIYNPKLENSTTALVDMLMIM